MAIVASLDVVLRAVTQPFETGMGKARKTLKGFNNALVGLAGGIGAASILRSATNATLEFERAMAKSTSIMGDLSDAMRGDMVDAAREAARETTFSNAQAAESFFFLASAGLDAEQAIAALPQVAKFAQAGLFDMALATDLATDAQSALGLTVKDARQNLRNLTRVTDVLVRANTLANASVQQFSEALTNKAGAAIRQVGKDIEEGVAVLAAFADQGVKGAEAGTALGIVMRDLQTKAIQNADEFKAFNVAVFDAEGEMNNMASIIRDVEMALAGMSDQQQKATLLQLGFADKSVSFIQSLLGQSEAIANYESKLRSAAGATDEVANKSVPAMDKAINRLKSDFDALANDALAPVLVSLADISEESGGLLGVFENIKAAFLSFRSAINDFFATLLEFSVAFVEQNPATKFANAIPGVDVNADLGRAMAEDLRRLADIDYREAQSALVRAENLAAENRTREQEKKAAERTAAESKRTNELLKKMIKDGSFVLRPGVL